MMSAKYQPFRAGLPVFRVLKQSGASSLINRQQAQKPEKSCNTEDEVGWEYCQTSNIRQTKYQILHVSLPIL